MKKQLLSKRPTQLVKSNDDLIVSDYLTPEKYSAFKNKRTPEVYELLLGIEASRKLIRARRSRLGRLSVFVYKALIPGRVSLYKLFYYSNHANTTT